MKFKKTFFPIGLWLLLIACSVPRSEAQTVYVTKTGTKYHRVSCQYLSKSQYAIAMKEAVDRGYQPCSVCEPGSPLKEQKASTPTTDHGTEKSAVPDTTQTSQTSPTHIPPSPKPKDVISQRCSATTKSGTRCKRMTTNASGRCFQHE